MTTPTRRRPPGRYDEAKELPKLFGIAFGLTFAVLVSLGAVRLYGLYGDKPVSGRTAGYDVTGDGAVVLTFDVDRKEPTRAAVCFVRARGADGANVAEADVTIAPAEPGQDRVRVRHTLLTRARAVTAEVVNCGTDAGRR